MSRKKRRGSKNSRKRPDHWTQKAKGEGYQARSVYKLSEIDRRFSILKNLKRVVDLGCAPGSWSEHISRRFPKAALVGIDIQRVDSYPGTFVHGSILTTPNSTFFNHLGGEADLVLSDMAPNTTGNRFGDHIRQLELAKMALKSATDLLRVGGHFVVKVFDGEDAYDYVQSIRPHFERVRRIEPEATRKESVEFFVLGYGRKKLAEDGENA